MVTRIRIRFAPQETKESDLFPGKNAFPFDPTKGPGYVWHCHILDHEDNDMMRPMAIVNDARPCLNCESGLINNAPDRATPAANGAARYSTPGHHNHSMPAASKPGAPAAEQPSRGTMPEQQQPQQQQQMK